MANFLEKLKKGMGAEPSSDIEEETEKTAEIKESEEIESAPQPKIEAKKSEKKKIPTIQIKKLELKKKEPIREEPTKEEFVAKKVPVDDSSAENSPKEAKKEEEKKRSWNFGSNSIGQLAIDVYQTPNDLVIQSAIAGIKPDSLDINIEKDIVTIRGIREKPLEENGDYFAKECYWGPFFREVILPDEADPNQVAAQMKDGILTIRIPRLLRNKKRRIQIRGS